MGEKAPRINPIRLSDPRWQKKYPIIGSEEDIAEQKESVNLTLAYWRYVVGEIDPYSPKTVFLQFTQGGLLEEQTHEDPQYPPIPIPSELLKKT